MAETTTTTCLPPRQAFSILLATLTIFSVVATEVPPNFITTIPDSALINAGLRWNCLCYRGGACPSSRIRT